MQPVENENFTAAQIKYFEKLIKETEQTYMDTPRSNFSKRLLIQGQLKKYYSKLSALKKASK